MKVICFRWARTCWFSLTLLGLCLSAAPQALAHGTVVASVPAPNSRFSPSTPPTQVEITFSEEIAPALSAIRVFDRTGEQVDLGQAQSASSENTRLAVALKPLPAGTYTVAWEALSTVDGHRTTGFFAFAVGEAALPTLPSTSEPAPGPGFTALAARWLSLIGQTLLLGTFAFQFFIWLPIRQADHPAHAALDRALAHRWAWSAWLGLGALSLGLILTPVAQNGTLADAGLWLSTQFGWLWAARCGLALMLALSLIPLIRQGHLPRWTSWAGLSVSVALTLTWALASHSAALAEGWLLAVLTEALHLLAAGAWVGGVIQLVIATHCIRKFLPTAQVIYNLKLLLNFSTLAAGLVGILLISGVYLAGQHVGGWVALAGTPYGVALLVKLLLALPALALAGLNLTVVRPRLWTLTPTSAPAPILARFHRLATLEAIVALTIIVAAGVLGSVQRGRDALRVAEQQQVALFQSADDLQVTLTVAPGTWGATNAFDVYVATTSGQPVSNAREIALRFSLLDRDLGVNTLLASAAGDGHYRAEGGHLALAGVWQIEIVVRRSEAYDTFVDFRLEAQPDGLLLAASPSPHPVRRLAQWLAQGGEALTGALWLIAAVGWIVPATQAARRKRETVLLLVPSLIALGVGASQLANAFRAPPPASTVDSQAVQWLADSDAAMNQLKSVRVTTLMPGPGETPNASTITFQAPNRFQVSMSTGPETIVAGAAYYARPQRDERWHAMPLARPFVFPAFAHSRQLISARLGAREAVESRQAQIVDYVLYVRGQPVQFTRWIDLETKWILRESMQPAEPSANPEHDHQMVSVYHDHNAEVLVLTPAPAEVGPTSPPGLTPPPLP